jgi:Major Facilitator Superfamily.
VRKSVFVAVGLSFMLYNSLYQYSWNAVYPLLLHRFDTRELSLIFSTFVVVSSLAQVVMGVVADYLSVRLTALFSAIAASLGWLLSSFVTDFYTFMGVWALGSFGEGSLYGVAINLVGKWFPQRGVLYRISLPGFGLGASSPPLDISHAATPSSP